MIRKFSIVLFMFLVLATSASSQIEYLPCYVTTLQNDTVYGIGNVSLEQNFCIFKPSHSADYKIYSPAEMNSFRVIDGKKYVTREILTDGLKIWYFLEYLVDGEIDLFIINHGSRYFVEKKGAEIIELNDNIKEIKKIDGQNYMVQDKRFLGYLRVYMSEAPQLYSQIDKMKKLDQRYLVKLSVDYHNAVCNEYECVNYTKRIAGISYKTELLSGVTFHDNFYSPMVGILLHVTDPLVSESLSLKFGVLYSDKPANNKTWKERNKKSYSLKFPISLQYAFGKSNFKPTVGFGWPTGIFLISSLQGGFIYSINPKLELNANASVDGLIMMAIDWQEDYFNNQLPHTLSVGVVYKIK